MYDMFVFVSASVLSGGAGGSDGVFSLRGWTLHFLLFEGHLEVSFGHFILSVVVVVVGCFLWLVSLFCLLCLVSLLMVWVCLIAIVLPISVFLHVY